MTHKNTLERRRLAGLCRCGREPQVGSKMCSGCVGKVVESTRKRTARRKAEGVCRCGKERKAGIQYCPACAGQHTREVNGARKKHLAAGRCACGQMRAAGKMSCERCLGRRKELTEKHKANGVCISCQCRPSESGHVTCDRCFEKARVKGRQIRTRYRKAVMGHYGGKCACCGESHDEFLTIDHKDNDGAEHRKVVDGAALYRWLMKNGYPENFQILCYNCNIAKGRYGTCPHCYDRVEALLT